MEISDNQHRFDSGLGTSGGRWSNKHKYGILNKQNNPSTPHAILVSAI